MIENIQIQMKSRLIKRQRNFFAGALGLMLITVFLLSARLSATTEKIVMVPGISKEMSVSGSDVSQSYLEETALLFISALLDLTPTTVSTKRDVILKYASKRSPESLKSLREYFAASEIEHKKFQLSTFFAPKKLHVDSKNLQVIVDGMLSTTFGKRGFEEKEVKYRLSFDYVGGYLQLREFTQITKREQEVVPGVSNE
jgi:type IV conjugative transfer system protein TraE